MKRVGILGLMIILVAMLISGCGGTGRTYDDRGWPDRITIVQMPDEHNPNAAVLHDSFRAALQDHLGIEVEELLAFEFAVGIEAMRANRLDILLVTPMGYFQVNQVADVEPLVTWTTEGAPVYKTVFVTRADNDNINSLEDLRGRTFAFVDPASSSGYMYPKVHMVNELGVDPDRLITPGYFFSTVAFSGNHNASLMGVVMGDFEAASVAYQMIDSLHDAGLIDRNDIKIFAETPLIPQPSFVINANLPDDLIEKIREFYLAFDDEEYFYHVHGSRAVRFVRSFHEDYAVIYDMVRILNLEF